MSINTYTATGRLGTDPELRFAFDGGVAIFTARIAISHWKKRDGQNEESTSWYDLKLFGGQAEAAAEQLVKGDLVIVVGRIETRNYEKKDGTQGYAVEFIASEIGKAITAPKLNAVKPRAERPALDDEPF